MGPVFALWATPGHGIRALLKLLYTSMAVAAWLVWKRGGFVAQRRALLLFLTQLGLNALWTLKPGRMKTA
ncbi:MAG: hypothetical protein EA353_08095 [Puniceicoccaceae bacterium]|nr:MAG: hypothetical protein EA353_08095 [Puniceicoccaceae bacterium]